MHDVVRLLEAGARVGHGGHGLERRALREDGVLGNLLVSSLLFVLASLKYAGHPLAPLLTTLSCSCAPSLVSTLVASSMSLTPADAPDTSVQRFVSLNWASDPPKLPPLWNGKLGNAKLRSGLRIVAGPDGLLKLAVGLVVAGGKVASRAQSQ